MKCYATMLARSIGLLWAAAMIASCSFPNASGLPTSPAAAPAASESPAAPASPAAATAGAAPTGAPQPATAQPATAQPAAQQASLTFAFPDDPANARAAADLVKAYTAAHPGSQIRAMPLPANDYPQLLQASLSVGAVDLFVATDGQAPALIKRNAVADLHSLLASGANLKPADFQPAALAVLQRGDALYGLPTDVTPQVMFYNEGLFAERGEAFPAPGWTWDDWLAKAKQLTFRSGDQVTVYGTALGTWANMVWGNGGELVSPDGKQTLLDQAAAAEGVQFAADMINIHKVAPLPKDAGGPDPVELFKNQQVAMMPGSSALASTLLAAKLPFKWSIAPLPAGKTPAIPLSIAGLFVSAQSQQQQAAAELAAWMAGPEGAAIKSPLMPFAAPALNSAPPRSGQISGEEAILAALQHGRTLPQLDVWPEAKALIDTALKPVWQGQSTASAAYKAVVPKVNALLSSA
jgi:multiple sugar transport system substrate-binding protein